MATQPAPPFDPRTQADRWLADYRAGAGGDDVVAAARDPAWAVMLEELAAVATADLGHARERVRRHAADIGTGFRAGGDAQARRWPVSPVPLMLPAAAWAQIAAGVAQRATLLEAVVADLYGPQRLVRDGRLPAAVMTGSPAFLRQLVGLTPPGGRHLHCIAMDLIHGPDGAWRVIADHVRAPAGLGDALENRLAVGRTLGGLADRLHIQRHAPFFAGFRAGLAAACRRVDPRLAILTPGRTDPGYAEQAHLARYLGMLLVEGADLAALEGRAYLRTIGGLKRIDGLWNQVDPRAIDPLTFDSQSRDGVPGLIDAWAAGELVVANAPGAGVVEAPAFAAFLPALALPLTGAPLSLPNVATWWCGGDEAGAAVLRDLDTRLIAPAFGVATRGLPDGARPGADLHGEHRAALLADLARRPQDYIGQERLHRSTMPVVEGDALVARAFTLRVFAARGGDGDWIVLPGGLARTDAAGGAGIGDGGAASADVCVHGPEPVAPVSLLQPADSLHIRRNPGTLPSRVADNFFWLGRYLERGEALLAAIRLLLGHSIDVDGGAVLAPATLGRLVGLIVGAGAAPHPASLKRADLTAFARTALSDPGRPSVAAVNARAHQIGGNVRDRLSADMIRLLAAPFPGVAGLLDRAGALQRRYAALTGLVAEHMVRTDAWRFLDLGRRIERGMAAARTARLFGPAGASADDLSTMLDLADSQITYRQRYPTGLARIPALDLIALDPHNPRSLAFQLRCIVDRLGELPVLDDDGMAEPQQAQASQLVALATAATAETLDPDMLGEVERRLALLSDAVGRRYFLQGAEPLRAGGLTLA